VIGQLLGYHLWDDLASNEDWLPGINLAKCRRTQRHTAKAREPAARIPVETCGCGFWLYRDFEDLLEGWGANFNPTPVSGSAGIWGFSPADDMEWSIIGAVEGGGRVIEGELGFRVEQARVVELYDEVGNPFVAEVADLFGVPVKPYPWPTATGIVEIQDRPGLPSRVQLWNGDRTLTFYVSKRSDHYMALNVASGFVTVVYRRDRIGQVQVPRVLRVEAI